MYINHFSTLFIIISIDIIQISFGENWFGTIVCFGDSHTDTGNVYNLTQYKWPLVPPYYQGRFSNGPVWIENFKDSEILNYAYGDATIDNNNLLTGFTGPNGTIVVPGIRQQIVKYLSFNDLDTVNLLTTMYIIWASGNEYIKNSSISSKSVVTILFYAMSDLLVADVKNIIVINLPPIHLFPAYNNSQQLKELVNKHNNYLLTNITQIQAVYKKASIQLFDLYSLIENILLNASAYKLNTVDKCWNIVNNLIISQCPNPNEYVFIDDYHFTSTIHQIIADNIRQFILSSALREFSSSKFRFFLCTIVLLIKQFY